MKKSAIIFVLIFSVIKLFAQDTDCIAVLHIGNDTTLCTGQNLQIYSGFGLTADNATFQWSTGEETDTIIVSSAGTFILEATVDTCVYLDTIVVDVINLPNPDLSIAESCFGSPTQFTTSLTPEDFNLVWFFGEGEQELNNSVNQIFTYSENGGQYSGFLNITDTSGFCTDTTFFTTEAFLQPTVDFTLNNTCFGETSLLINNSTGVLPQTTYLFSPDVDAEFIALTDMQDFSYLYNAPGVFMPTLIAVNESTCRDTFTQEVSVFSVPTVSFSGLEDEYCSGDTTLLSGFPIGGTFIESYVENVDSANGEGIFTAPATGGAEVTYSFTTTDGCVVTEMQVTEVFSLPDVQISGLETNYCLGQGIDTLTGNFLGGNFTGDILDSFTEGENDFARIDLNTAGNIVIEYAYTDENGCNNVVEVESMVNDLPDFSFPETTGLLSGESVEIGYFDSLTDLAFLWSNNATTPTITTENPGFFVLCVDDIVTGCGKKDTTEVVLVLNTDEIQKAESFTIFPNPVHDFLQIETKSQDGNRETDFAIYNSSGQLVRIVKQDFGNDILRIDISNFSTGTYFLKRKNEVAIFQKVE